MRRVPACVQELCEEGLLWLGEVFQYALQALYESDVLPEEVINTWAHDAQTAAQGSARRVRHAQCGPFLTWLAEAESDSGEEGDD